MNGIQHPALDHRTRRTIFAAVMDAAEKKERCPTDIELSDIVQVKLNAPGQYQNSIVGYHLKILERAGLIRRETEWPGNARRRIWVPYVGTTEWTLRKDAQ